MESVEDKQKKSAPLMLSKHVPFICFFSIKMVVKQTLKLEKVKEMKKEENK